MARIMVVDDESLIRQWIVMCLQSDGIAKEEIDEAKNGDEALLLFGKQRYDLIFTDITMPKTDGLSLIKRIRKTDREVSIVILTCHEDFTYAKTALKYNVNEYLLKSELDKEEILRVVSNSRYELLNRRGKHRQRDLFLCSLLHQGCHSPITPDILLENYISLNNKKIFALAFYSESFDRSKVPDCYGNSFENLTVFFDRLSLHILLANINGEVYNPVQLDIEIKKLLKGICSESPCFGQICFADNIQQLPQIIQKAVFLWEVQFFNCKNVLFSTDSKVHDNTVKNKIAAEKANILLNYRNNGNEITKHLILDLCQIFIREKLLDSSFLKRTVIDMLEEIETRADVESIYLKDYIDNIQNADNIDDIKSFIHEFFARMPDLDNTSDCILKTKEYICMHYNEPLTLSDAAGKACLSEEYFSRLFKKETGQNFTEYMIEIRMNRAQKLLQSSNFNINEIAEMVGIPNPSYFSSQYKRFWGVSPSTVRKTQD